MNHVILKDGIKYSPEEIKDLMQEFYSAYCHGNFGNGVGGPEINVEDMIESFNMFLQWMGSKKPIKDDFKISLGWGEIKKNEIRKRFDLAVYNAKEKRYVKICEQKAKELLKDLKKNSKKETKTLQSIW